jgi:hypothetical protein
MRDKNKMHDLALSRRGRGEDALGPTSDIGARLRALYGAVQDEGIPEHLLDLLDRLDAAERGSLQAGGKDKSNG